jgi:hypothetical protein
MRQASKRIPDSAEKTVRDIRRATRRHHSAEEKIRTGHAHRTIGAKYGAPTVERMAAALQKFPRYEY